uniref:NADH-ubiquinone oxidoreductase chain 6 n=1 Tax=Epeorus herklotsi TaxID=2305083 RepID=A0A346NG80_9INSE|nr:NADH dehydrogenase subunit 6 [Epeorus herklotsi]AXQ88044.1 NADH dehydrogenase subunit 6 [Epeorus herklotsi]
MLLTLSLTVGFTFLSMTHPLAMGLILLCQTLLISLMTGLLAPTFWFSYVLFLVFLGGMLVLFIYVTSLASNEMFSISAQTMLGTIISGSIILVFTCVNDPSLWVTPNLSDQTNLIDWTSSQPTLKTLLIKLYNNPTHLLTLLLVLYLFLTLVAVVTITQIFQGPLRSKN